MLRFMGLRRIDKSERLHFHFSLWCIGEGNGNHYQCSCLEIPRDGGAWCADIYGIAQSLTWLKQLSSSSSICVGSVMLSKHLIFCCPLLKPSIFPRIRVFSNESALHIRWPKYWSFNFSISLSSAYLWLISFRMDWFDLLAVQRTSKRLLQHHPSKTAILQCSAFFMVQISHPYRTTGKTIVWLYGPLLAKWSLCSLICFLTGLSLLFFQGTSVFSFRGCSHHLQWFWSPRK